MKLLMWIWKKNFEHAGQVLAEVWGALEIDKFPVVAEYVGPKELSDALLEENEDWYAKHLRESQYFLQIAKCDSLRCCATRRSSLWNLLPTVFSLHLFL